MYTASSSSNDSRNGASSEHVLGRGVFHEGKGPMLGQDSERPSRPRCLATAPPRNSQKSFKGVIDEHVFFIKCIRVIQVIAVKEFLTI